MERGNKSSSYTLKTRFDQSVLSDISPKLGHLDIELTHRCNNSCVHCCINQAVGEKKIVERELDSMQIESILSQAAELGCMSVRFTGGEPLLRSDFTEIYRFARSLGMRVVIFTNATLITSEWIKLWLDLPPMAPIEVSLYGMTQASCEAISGNRSAFSTAQKGLDLLLENKIPCLVKGVLLPQNRGEVDDFERWARARIPSMDGPVALALYLDKRWLHDDSDKDRQIDALRAKPGEVLDILTRNDPVYSQDAHQFCHVFAKPPGERLFGCSAGKGRAALDPYGNLLMCQPLRHPKTRYRLSNGSLREAMEGFFPRIRALKAENPEYLRRCARCFLKGFCEMCPGKSWGEHQSLDTPVEYLCQHAHTQARHLGYLSEGEEAWGVEDWQTRIRAARDRGSGGGEWVSG